jgi:hypothetical protein|tara:strand:+ start:504 stop:1133 length:630 start_codon:yes stop_codon:yes gene_type:complete
MYVGPDIVQDGLVAVFDAGSTRSYPGTGSTWYNLIGSSAATATLSATSIGTTAAGVMTFGGVDDKITISLLNLTSNDFTVIGVSQRPTSNSGRLISADNNWLLGHWGTGSRKHYAVGWVCTNTYNDANTHIFCATGDISADTYKFLDDNVDYTTSSTGGSAGPNGFSLGNITGNEWGVGTITLLLVYNRVLTDAEIDQNFNAQKNRFGV